MQTLGKCKLRVPELDFVVLKGGKTENGDYILDNIAEVGKFFKLVDRQWAWEPYPGIVFFGKKVNRKTNTWTRVARVGEVVVFDRSRPFTPFTVLSEEAFKETYQRVIDVV